MPPIKCNRCERTLYGSDYQNHHKICLAPKRRILKTRAGKIRALSREVANLKKKLEKANQEKAIASHPLYGSDAWRKLRYETLKKYGFACMACGGKERELHVDHIKPVSRFPDLALEPSNLQVLCKDCNLGKSNTHLDDFTRQPPPQGSQ